MNFSTGWVPKPEEVWKTVKFLEEQTDNGPALFAQAAPNLMADLDDEDPVFFWDFEEKVLGKRLNSWNQLQVGSCVAFGCGRAVQDLMLIQIAAGSHELFPAEVATEPIYGGSRVEVGGGQINGDGSVGAWAARWVKEWGVLLRQKYGSYDLLKYDEARCRDYGRRGCPDPLEPEAKKHPVKSTAMVRTGDELWAALGAYKPVSVASMQGFTTTLREGYCEPSGQWAHQMFLRARFVSPKRGKSVVIQNSWGDGYLSGERFVDVQTKNGVMRVELPGGAFATTLATAHKMVSQEDSFAYAGLDGWKKTFVDHTP